MQEKFFVKKSVKIKALALCLSLVFGSTPLTALAANSGGTDQNISGDSAYVGIYQPVSGIATGGKVYIDSGFTGRVYGGYTRDGSATGNSVYISGGRVTGDVYGGFADAGNATGNSVYISGGIVRNVLGAAKNSVYGGWTKDGSATGNSVYMTGGTVGAYVYGGFADAGSATGNSVYMTGGTVGAYVYGGFADAGNATGNSVYISGNSTVNDVIGGFAGVTATGNSVYISGNSTVNDVTGGWATSGSATGNSVYISGGTVTTLSGGFAVKGNATGNSVYMTGGTVNYVAGGQTQSGVANSDGDAIGNSVYISGGEVVGVYGGRTNNGNVTGNSVYISGGTIGGNIYGGFIGNTATGTATNNVVTIVNKPDLTNANLAGGWINSSSDYMSAGNKLNFLTSGIKAVKLGGFQYNNFALFSGGGAGLELTGDAAFQAGAIVSAPQALAGSNLAVGDTVTLLKANDIPVDPTLPNGQSFQGLALIYDYSLQPVGTEIIATITGKGANPKAKALSESNLGASSFVNFGADLAAGKGMDSAVNSALTNADGFSATGMNNLRLNTGSHVDTSGISLMTGFAKKHGDTTLGYFIEGGWSSYDTFNGQDNQGNGHSNYYGLGMLVKKQLKDNKYFDASIRLGQIRSGYTNDSAGSYLGAAQLDTNPMYYSAHLGIGKTYELKGKKELDIFARYLYSHVNSQTKTVLGDTFNFDAIDSHRLQLGTKYTFNKTDKSNYYVGLIYEYELSGKAKGSVYGYKLASPSLKGSTGILDIGMQLKPNADSNMTVDLSLQGYAGKRQGFSGNVQVNFQL